MSAGPATASDVAYDRRLRGQTRRDLRRRVGDVATHIEPPGTPGRAEDESPRRAARTRARREIRTRTAGSAAATEGTDYGHAPS